MSETKSCTGCRRELPVENFYLIKRRGKQVRASRCKECMIAARVEHGKVNRARDAAYLRSWRKRNVDHVRSEARRRNRELRAEAITAYGATCACCGENTIEFLAIDHVNGDGAEHRRSTKTYRSGPNFYLWLRQQGFPQDGRFQVLCHNCNLAKALYGKCPHARSRAAYTHGTPG